MAVEIKISSDSRQAQSDLTKLQKLLKNLQNTSDEFKNLEVAGTYKGIGILSEKAKQANSNLRNTNNTITEISKNTNRLSSGFSNLTSLVKGLTVAFAGLALVSRVTQAADTFTNLGNKIALVTGRTTELIRVQNELYQISIKSRGSFESSVEVYNRFGLALKDLGVSNRELLLTTEAVQKAVAISGTGAESARAAIIQLGQGLASGQLRGQELLSVLEQTPRVARAIADGLKIPFAALRSEAERGSLTTDSILKALISQLPQINKEFSLLGPTFAQGVQRANTAFNRFIVEVDKGFKLTSSIGKLLVNLADILDGWADTVSLRIQIFAREIRLIVTDIKFFIKDITSSLNSFLNLKIAVPNFGLDTSFIKSILTSMTELLSTIDKLSSNLNLFQNIEQSFNRFKLWIINTFKEIYMSIVGGSYWTDTIDGIIFHTKRLIPEVMRSLSKFKEEVSQNIRTALLSAIITFAFTLYNLENTIKYYFNRISNIKFNFKDKLSENIRNKLLDIVLNTSLILYNLENTIKSYFNRISNINLSFTDKLKIISKVSNTFNLSILETILLLNRVQRLFLRITDSIKSLLNFEFKLNLSKFLSGLDPIINAISNFGKFIINVFFKIYDEIVGNSYWPDTINGIISYAERLIPRLESIFNNLKKYLLNTFQSIKGYFVLDNIKLKIKSLVEDVKIKFDLLFQTNLQDIISKFKPLENLLSNLTTPFEKLIASIRNFISSVKDSAIKSIFIDKLINFTDRLKTLEWGAVTSLGAVIVSLFTLGPLFTTILAVVALIKEIMLSTTTAVQSKFNEFTTELGKSLEEFTNFFDRASKEPQKVYEAVERAFKEGIVFSDLGGFLSKQTAEFFGRFIGRAFNDQLEKYSIGENIADVLVFALGLWLSKSLRVITAVAAGIKLFVIGEESVLATFRKIFNAIANFGKNALKEAGFGGNAFADSSTGGLLAAILIGTISAGLISSRARSLILAVFKSISTYFILGKLLNREGENAGRELGKGIRLGFVGQFNRIFSLFGKLSSLGLAVFATYFSRNIANYINEMFDIEDPLTQLFAELAVGVIAFFSTRALAEFTLRFLRPFVKRFLGIRNTIGLGLGESIASKLLAGFLSIGAFGGGFGGFLLAEWISKKFQIESEIVNFAIYAGTIAGGVFAGRFIASAIASFVAKSIWAPLLLAFRKQLAAIAFTVSQIIFGGGVISKVLSGGRLLLAGIAGLFSAKAILVALGLVTAGSLLYYIFFGEGTWQERLNNIWEQYIKKPYEAAKAYFKDSALYQLLFGNEGWVSKLENFWKENIVTPLENAFNVIESKWTSFANTLLNSKLGKLIFGDSEKETALPGSSFEAELGSSTESTPAEVSAIPTNINQNEPLPVILDERSLPPPGAGSSLFPSVNQQIPVPPFLTKSILQKALEDLPVENLSFTQAGARVFDNIIKKISDIIAKGESEAFGGYTAVNLGEAKGNRGQNRKDLTSLSIGEILKLQSGPNKEFNAAGRYQFTAATLEETAKKANISLDTIFDAATQDKLFKEALLNALKDILPKSGESITDELVNQALLRVARLWAASPSPVDIPERKVVTGGTYYPSVGNNKASIPLPVIREAVVDLFEESIKGYATGGMIRGPGSGTSDSILARISNGEFIVNANAAAKNRTLLELINSGMNIPGFANGTAATNSSPPIFLVKRELQRLFKDTFGPQADNFNLNQLRPSEQNTVIAALKQTERLNKRMNDFVKDPKRTSEDFGELLDEIRESKEGILQLVNRVANPDKTTESTQSFAQFRGIGSDAAKTFTEEVSVGFTSFIKGQMTFKDLGLFIADKFTSQVIDTFTSQLTKKLFESGGIISRSLETLFSGIASFGASSGSFLGSIGKFFGFASGGLVNGPGTGTSDSILARLSNGEYVVNAAATKRNRGLLEAINSGKMPRFAEGGAVGDGSPGISGDNTSSGDIAPILSGISSQLAILTSAVGNVDNKVVQLGSTVASGFSTMLTNMISAIIPIGLQLLLLPFQLTPMMVAAVTAPLSSQMAFWGGIILKVIAASNLTGPFASGGYVSGPGSGTSDSILARLSNGEYVINAASTKKYGPLLEAINSDVLPKFADGGMVGSNIPMIPDLSSSNNVRNSSQSQQVFNITITGDISRQTKSEIYRMIPEIASGVNQVNKENNFKYRGR